MRMTIARCSVALMFVMAITTVVSTQQRQGTGDEQRLLQLERDWAQAMIKGDVGFMERTAHPDYTFVSPDGRLVTRSEDLADLKSGAYKAESATVDDVKVRVYGGDTAVVTGRTVLKGTYKGQDISGEYRFTDTFVKDKGEWRCVATQSTRVAKQP